MKREKLSILPNLFTLSPFTLKAVIRPLVLQIRLFPFLIKIVSQYTEKIFSQRSAQNMTFLETVLKRGANTGFKKYD